MSTVTVGYFLEDVAQEALLTAVVSHEATAHGLTGRSVRHEVRAAASGSGTMVRSLRQFLRDYRDGTVGPFDILVVARDSDCRGYTHTKRELQTIIARSGYPGPCALAIPDPHIERWYLLDPAALRRAVDSAQTPAVPPYRCQRGHYKQALMRAFEDTAPQLGGIEWADDIVRYMDFYRAAQNDPAFGHFVSDLRQALAPLARGAVEP